MMHRCVNCGSPLLKEKEVLNLRKISWLICEFDCPECQAPLTTDSFWEGVLRITILSTTIVSFLAVLLDATNWYVVGVLFTGLLMIFYAGLQIRTRLRFQR